MLPRCDKLAPADPTTYWTPFVHLPKRLTCADGALFCNHCSAKETPIEMFPLLIMLFQQPQLRATQPTYFFPVAVLLLVAGGVAWLIAAVLGFARSPAFGPSARWFS